MSRRWFQVPAALLLLLAGVTLACAWHYGIWSWRDLQVYRSMQRECHPVWEELHFGRIRAGQDVEEAIARTRPPVVERFGEFVLLSYQDPREGIHVTGVTVVAKGGRLAAASA